MIDVVISANNVSHWFGKGGLRKQILFDVSTEIRAGEIVILTGPSGSGKTTFLTLIGGLRSIQAGSLRVLGHELRDAEEQTLIGVRQGIGYIFQSHNLIDALTARQNVEMALQLQVGLSNANRQHRAEEMLERVGLKEHGYKYPNQLSGGQRQRVGVARALVGQPRIVLADEPTGSLDKDTGREIVNLIQRLASEERVTALLVTHDSRIFDIADRILSMEDGRLSSLMRALTSQTGRMKGNLTRDIRQGRLVQRTQALDAEGFAAKIRELTQETRDLVAVMEATRGEALQVMQDQVLEAFTHKMTELLEAENVQVYLVDDERGVMWSVKREDGGLKEFSIPLGEGRAGRVAATGEAEHAEGALCVPISNSGKRVFAVIEVERSPNAGGFASRDEERLYELTHSLGNILESWCMMGCACRRAELVASSCAIPPDDVTG